MLGSRRPLVGWSRSARFCRARNITSPLGFLGDPAAGLGGAAARSARHRHGRRVSHRLRGLGDDHACRPVRPDRPRRILSAAAHLHVQRFGAEPGAERGRRMRRRTETICAAPMPSSTAAYGTHGAPRRRQYSSAARRNGWPISAAGPGTSGGTAITWSDQLFDIYGARRQEFGGTFDEFVDFMHPDDRVRVQASIDAGRLKTGSDFSHEERICARTAASATCKASARWCATSTAPPSACSASAST